MLDYDGALEDFNNAGIKHRPLKRCSFVCFFLTFFFALIFFFNVDAVQPNNPFVLLSRGFVKKKLKRSSFENDLERYLNVR